jgi:anthranilate synthase component 2
LILLLDNFDSFTYNLVDYFKQLNVDVLIFRNNAQLEEITKHSYNGVVLSPGPGKPYNSGIMLKVIHHYMDKIPILGICLGHQAVGNFFNAQVINAEKPMHGKISKIKLNSDYLFKKIPGEINVVRYHSLIINQLPEELENIAAASNGEIMAIRHKYKNIRGLQFHPEAALTDFGKDILKNWVDFNEI